MQTPKTKPKQPKQRKQQAIDLATALTLALTLMLQLFAPITVHAEETERSITYNASLSYTGDSGGDVEYTWKETTTGIGKFHVLPYSYTWESEDKTFSTYGAVFASNNEFTVTDDCWIYSSSNSTAQISTKSYIGAKIDGFYMKQFDFITIETEQITSANFPKVRSFSSYDEYQTWYNSLSIDSFDFTKDDYLDSSELLKDLDTKGTYNEEIPAPKMTVDNKLNYRFTNDGEGYMYQVKGRWRSIDNVSITKGVLADKLYYKSTIQCDLLHWIAPIDEVSTTDTSSFSTIGKNYFDNFLSMYPIESRNVVFTNKQYYENEWYEQYPNYARNFKDSLSSFNSVEVYVRYFVKNDDGSYSYGKWTHYYNNLTTNGSGDMGYRDGMGELDTEHYQSENGLTNEEMKDVENLDDSRTDTDVTGSQNSSSISVGNSSIDIESSEYFSNVVKVILSLFEQAKTIFSMYGTVFSFLPQWVIDIISVSVVIVCFIGIWKVIR